MYYNFLISVIVVLFLCSVVIMIDLSIHRKYSQYMLGVVFGLITIFVMTGKIMVVEGRYFDFRYITMTMSGLIGGPVAAVIATIISSLYRYNVGGTGSMGGIIDIIIFACFGSILGIRVKSSQNGKKVFFWFIVGIIMAFVLIFIIAFTPPWKSDTAKVLRIVAGPFLIATPLATTIIFNFYFWTHEFFGKATILNTIINFSPINLMIFDPHGPILLSKNLKMQLPSSPYIENPYALLGTDETCLNTTKPQHREIATEDGRNFVADLSRFQMPSGKYACVAIVNDVTDRKREQETLREAKERFSKVFQLSPHMMTIIRKSDYRYIYVNHRFLETRGFAREDVIGKTPMEIGVPETEYQGIIEALEERESVQNLECSLVSKYGLIGTIILSASNIQIDDQECILFAYNDVTEMKRMQTERVEQLTKYLTLEEDLSQSNQLIADIINNMPDSFYVLDNQWRFTFVNAKAEELLLKTREELLGEVLWETIPQARGSLHELNYQKARKDCFPITFETRSLLHKDTWYEVTAFPFQFGLSVYYRDITERKLAHEKLIKTQEEIAKLDRLNLVGQLAAGIGHEIRNPITTVRGYLQLLGAKPGYAAQKSTFELMISELDRANAIITEFLSLARTKQTERKSQNLNDILNNLYPLIEADTFIQNKQICFIAGEIPKLEIDEKEIAQLVLNLIRNGLEAMKERGCLTIKSYVEDNKVVLAIKDEGCGIPSEDLNKLGTPFFTTKDNGTGLGMASCYKIADSHNAKIHIDSSSRGTTFFIFFPIPDAKQEQNEKIA